MEYREENHGGKEDYENNDSGTYPEKRNRYLPFEFAKFVVVAGDERSGKNRSGSKAKGISQGEIFEGTFEAGYFLENRALRGVYDLDNGILDSLYDFPRLFLTIFFYKAIIDFNQIDNIDTEVYLTRYRLTQQVLHNIGARLVFYSGDKSTGVKNIDHRVLP
jgi:hypothetical protein